MATQLFVIVASREPIHVERINSDYLTLLD